MAFKGRKVDDLEGEVADPGLRDLLFRKGPAAIAVALMGPGLLSLLAGCTSAPPPAKRDNISLKQYMEQTTAAPEPYSQQGIQACQKESAPYKAGDIIHIKDTVKDIKYTPEEGIRKDYTDVFAESYPSLTLRASGKTDLRAGDRFIFTTQIIDWGDASFWAGSQPSKPCLFIDNGNRGSNSFEKAQ